MVRLKTKIREASNIYLIKMMQINSDYDGDGELFFISDSRLGSLLFRLAALLNIQDKNKSFKIVQSNISLWECDIYNYDWNSIFQKNIIDHISERSENEYDVSVREDRSISRGKKYQELPIFPRKKVLYDISCYSYEYFKDIDIHNYFIFKDKIIDYIREKYDDLLKCETVSIHVRRTDYLSSKFRKTLWSCSNRYYETALSMLKGIEKVVVFSDDIEWCKKNFRGNKFVFIEGESQYVDLCLMSFLKNNIIPNSAFGWWGAYLNRNKNKRVICPEYYHRRNPEDEEVYLNRKYLYPDSWTTIDNRENKK